MKKITLLFAFVICNPTFGGSKLTFCTKNDLVDVVIPDVTIQGAAMYLDTDYQVPTRLYFPNLISVEGSLDISRNSNLMVIEAPLLKKVGHNFIIDENADLLEIYLPRLNKVDANLVFVENPQLERIALSSFQQSDGDVHIYANPNLIWLNLAELEKVCGGIAFHLNHSLKTIDLPKLKSIGHYCGQHIGSFFHVFNNNLLELINAPNLKKVDFVMITNNPALKELNLCKIVVDHDFDVRNNNININSGPPYCPEVEGEKENVNGNSEEEENVDGVNTQEEVEEEKIEENDAEVYPNPSEGYIHIDFEIPFKVIFIYDYSGNLIKTFTSIKEQYNLSGIVPGIYLLVIEYTNGSSKTKKIIIK